MMEEKILKRLALFDHEPYYIVGVSGGCDSMCLLDLLRKSHLKVVICHVNYNLRHDTYEDYNVVYGYAKKYNIPFHYKEVKEYNKDNFQQFARHIRYDFYHEVGKLYNTDKVFLGHHKDDVHETIMMQMERNGKHVFWGIKDESWIRGNHVYRVLLDVTKKEILAYCEKYHIDYHDDYTNFETHFRRDYLRNIVLKEMPQDQKEALLNKASVHNEWLRQKRINSQSILDQVFVDERLYFSKIEDQDLEDVIYLYLEKYIPIKRISKSLVEEMIQLIKNQRPNCCLSLPVNLRFIKEYDNGYIQSDTVVKDYNYVFDHFEKFECPYFKLEDEGHLNEGIYLSDQDFPITIRNFKPGDIVHTKVGHKKVNRLFIDAKIPALQRKKWPILLNKDGEILLIPHIVKNFRYLDTKANVFVVK